MEWNNKQVDITDHYCLVEIKHSGQRRFISLCFGVLSFLSPAENGNQHDAIKGPSPVFVYTPIIEKLITERQNLMREILCASLMFCCFFIFSPIFLPCILFFCFFSFLQFFPFSIFFSFFFFFLLRIIGKLRAIREIWTEPKQKKSIRARYAMFLKWIAFNLRVQTEIFGWLDNRVLPVNSLSGAVPFRKL